MSDYLKDIPRWALVIVAFLGLLAIGGVGTWAGAALQAATEKNNQQDMTLANHEWRIAASESAVAAVKSLDAKFDKVLERLGANK